MSLTNRKRRHVIFQLTRCLSAKLIGYETRNNAQQYLSWSLTSRWPSKYLLELELRQ